MGKRKKANPVTSLAPAARELATRISAAFQGNALVTRFVERYVTEQSRPGLVGNPLQRRELMSAIRRESLLALVARAHDQFPGLLLRPRPAELGGQEMRAAEHFREDCLTALGYELLLFPEEIEDFRRDLDLYTQLGSRQSRGSGFPSSRGTRSAEALEEGPFVDRAAFLLDPSLLEKARAATAAFLVELHELADHALAAAFHDRRSRPAHRLSRPGKPERHKPKSRRARRPSRRSFKKRR